MDKTEINSKAPVDLKRNRDITALVLSLLLSGVLLSLLVAPTYDKKVALEQANLTKQEDLKNKKELLDNIDNFNKNVKNDDGFTKNSQKLVAIIPNRNNFEDFFVHLKERSKGNNLELTDMSLKDIAPTVPTAATPAAAGTVAAAGEAATTAEASAKQLKAQGISLQLRGSYSDFVKFTKELENGIAFVQADSFQVSAAETEAAVAPAPGEEVPEQPLITDPILDFELELRFIYY